MCQNQEALLSIIYQLSVVYLEMIYVKEIAHMTVGLASKKYAEKTSR